MGGAVGTKSQSKSPQSSGKGMPELGPLVVGSYYSKKQPFASHSPRPISHGCLRIQLPSVWDQEVLGALGEVESGDLGSAFWASAFPSLGLSVLGDNEGVDMLPLAPFKSNDFSSSKPPSF